MNETLDIFIDEYIINILKDATGLAKFTESINENIKQCLKETLTHELNCHIHGVLPANKLSKAAQDIAAAWEKYNIERTRHGN